MILEEIKADEPFPLAVTLHPRLTVVTGLGPKRRAWLAAAVANAMAGRDTTLWGVAEVVGLRVDLGDTLVVRATAGIDAVIGPELWRSDYYGPDGAQDDLWPSSSLPEGSHGRAAVATAPPPAVAAPDDAPAPASARRRRWRRGGGGGSAPGAGQRDEAPVAGLSGAGASPPPIVPPALLLPPDDPPVVPPSVAVADPPTPPILDEPGPPQPGPRTIPPRPVVRPRAGSDQAPPPPLRPAVLDAPPPPGAGPRPVAPDLPPPPPPLPPAPTIDPRLEVRAAELQREVAECQAEVAARQAAAAAIVVPAPGDAGPVAAALRELEACRADEEEAAFAARRLAERWLSAEEEAGRARTARVPAWLLESARRNLEQARQELADAEADADDEQPLDMGLVDQLEAAHREVARLEARRSTAQTRRRLHAARDQEAVLLRQLGLPGYASLAPRLDLNRRRPDGAARRKGAVAAVGEAEAVWAELHAPRDDSAAADAAARLAEVWAEVTAFLGHRPSDVLAALRAHRPADPARAAAEAALEAALAANGVTPPSADDLVATAEAWLGAAGERAAAVAAAEEAARRAGVAVRRAEAAARTAAEGHAEAVAAVAAASAAGAARRAAADVAHEEATARWQEDVRSAEAAHAAALERWGAAAAVHQRWATACQEAEAVHEHQLAEHRAAAAAFEHDRRAALAEAQREADEAWEAAVARLEAEHEARRARRAAWERRREQAEVEWQAQLDAAAAERRRLEEERAAALAAYAAWEERHVPAPELPELKAMLLQRVTAATNTGLGGGSVPLVVDDALSSLPVDVAAALFGLFVQVSGDVQVVYLTDDPATVAMARRIEGIPVVEVEAAA